MNGKSLNRVVGRQSPKTGGVVLLLMAVTVVVVVCVLKWNHHRLSSGDRKAIHTEIYTDNEEKKGSHGNRHHLTTYSSLYHFLLSES